MATSKINNPHVPGSVLAESTGNKTFAQHLSALYSAYLALGSKERKLCAIIEDNRIFRITDTTNQPRFGRQTQAASGVMYLTNIYWASNNPHYFTWEIKATGTSVTDSTDETANTTLQLVLGL